MLKTAKSFEFEHTYVRRQKITHTILTSTTTKRDRFSPSKEIESSRTNFLIGIFALFTHFDNMSNSSFKILESKNKPKQFDKNSLGMIEKRSLCTEYEIFNFFCYVRILRII